jgi:hypothetical protein
VSIFETQLLPAIVLIGMFSTIVYAYYCQRQDIGKRARKMALGEAAAALQSLADIAMHASNAHLAMKDRHNALVAAGRHYYYDRAASIVRSIPVDRM